MIRSPRRLLVLTACLSLAACDDPTTDPIDAAVESGVGGPGTLVSAGDVTPLVLGVWGDGQGTVWFAGGAPGDQRLLAYLDGDTIRRASVPSGSTLWWVWGASPDRVWACGQDGQIVSRRGDHWARERTDLPDTAVLWGLWGSSASDLWAVGGSQRPNGPKGVLLRSSGDGLWNRVADPALPEGSNLFKVWGTGADDIHIVGDDGVALHWDGAQLARVDVGVDTLVFTVHGQAGGPVLAVGGTSDGAAFAWDGSKWVAEVLPEGTPGLNGVYVRPDGAALASGVNGVLLERDAEGSWRDYAGHARGGRDTLHAVWAPGDIWAVGGDMLRGTHGLVLSSRLPTPSLDLAEVAPPDGGLPDAAPDVRVDLGRDAAPHDVGRPDAQRDAQVPDAMDTDAVVPDAVVLDGVVPDARVVDAAPDGPPPDGPTPDGPVPDAARADAELPGPGEQCKVPSCEDGVCEVTCSGDLECWKVFLAIDEAIICTELCLDGPEDCEGYGPDPCCFVPGPQLLEPYCVPRAIMAEGCPE